MLSKIYNLLKYCYEDSMINQFPGIEFQLFILSTKSLIPFEDKVGCMFDLDRYKNELDVFDFYKNGNDEIIDNYIKYKNVSNIEDELLEFKIISTSITNVNWYILIEEVLKISLLFTKNKNSILDSIILSSVIYEYLNEDIIEIETLKNRTKERVIEFSLKEIFKKYNSFYINEIDKSFMIGFEKERIDLIINETFFSVDRISKYKVLQHILTNTKATKIINKDNEAVLSNFSSYLYKLRKGIISPEKLKIAKDKIPDLKQYLINSSFTHPLLGKCIVIKRGDKEIILRNKLGLLKVII